MKFAAVVLLALWLPSLASAQKSAAPSMESIGLSTGQKAPAFALPDQFGHEQSNETLRGSHGTVILFFRSADW